MRHVIRHNESLKTKPLSEAVVLILASLAQKPRHGCALLTDGVVEGGPAEYQEPPLFQGRSPSGGRESSRFTPNRQCTHYEHYKRLSEFQAYDRLSVTASCPSNRFVNN